MATKAASNIHKGAGRRKRRPRDRARVEHQFLLARVVGYAMGDDLQMPRPLVADLLALKLPWVVMGVDRTAPVNGAVLHEYLGRLFRGALILAATGEAMIPSLTLDLTFGAFPMPLTPVGTVRGDIDEVLCFQALNLVQSAGFDRLRKCDCGRAFVKSGRREFCSVQCQKRVFMRRKRAKERAYDLRQIERLRQEGKRHGKAKR